MIRRPTVFLVTLGLLVLGLLSLWTPLLKRLREYTWQALVVAVARGFQVGEIEVQPDVQDQLARLQSENIQLRAEIDRFERLAAQLDEPQYQHFRALPAVVAMRPIDTFRSRYVINRGIRDGVNLGAPVVIHGSTLVGFVVELSEETSVFQLLLHPASSVEAEVRPREGEPETLARGLVVGAHYTSAQLTTVPRDKRLSSEQEVVSVAQGSTLPAGLLLGRVGQIHSSESEAYQRATLVLPYHVDELEAVAVLLPWQAS